MNSRIPFCVLAISTMIINHSFADFENGVPFGPIHGDIDYEVLVNGDYYQTNYQVQGGYDWTVDGFSSYASGGPEFNYDRSIAEVVFDFSNTKGFNHIGATLNLTIDWDLDFEPNDNVQDQIFLHAYDVFDLPGGVTTEDYLDPKFGSPPNSFFDFHDGVVTRDTGYISPAGLLAGPELSINIDLTDIFNEPTQTATFQVEYVDPDLESHLNRGSILQYQLTWSPIPEPNTAVVLGLIVCGLGIKRSRNRRIY